MKPQRFSDCVQCRGRIRWYPNLAADDSGRTGSWAHLNRADWINDPHDAVASEEAQRAAFGDDPEPES